MPIVVLDPGHGPLTAGKRSPDETLLEYEFNRDVTARLKEHLERHGIKVVLTNLTGQDDISLKERVRISNNIKADIFVSIHANAFGDDWNSANGWEVYCWKFGGKAEQLAKYVHNESIPFLSLRDRGIKEANFYVIRYTDAPAILIEHGFYTNKNECELLKTASFREKCAIADAKGILKYFNIQWFDPIKKEQDDNVLYKVQVGAFAQKDNAIKLCNDLIGKGYKPIIVEQNN